jgi:phosphoglycolate phosphatase-like HAD superfamily hydrolase
LDDEIARLYQQVYLEDGMFLEEALTVSPADLWALRESARVVAVTVRPREVAEGLLARHRVLGAFHSIVTSFGAPDAGLSALIARTVLGSDEVPYVLCATPAMVDAAKRNGAIAIGVAPDLPARRPLMEAGCRAVVSRLDRLTKVLESRNTG